MDGTPELMRLELIERNLSSAREELLLDDAQRAVVFIQAAHEDLTKLRATLKKMQDRSPRTPDDEDAPFS